MNKKKIIILCCVILIIGSLLLHNNLIKYNARENNNFNYTNDDFKTIAMYIDGNEVNSIPGDGYVIDTDNTYCYTKKNNEKKYNLIYTDKYGKHIFNKVNKDALCYLYFKSDEIYKEDILNGADPVLKEGLIPVLIDKNGKVTKASLYGEWYKYKSKNWANAVILVDETKTYEVGENIPESNIESYFVWIPRYKYKIWNTGLYDSAIQLYQPGSTTEPLTYDGSTLSYPAPINGNARTIEIVFENKNTAVSNGTQVGEYLTHPAFTAFNTNGLWVGKFETGYKGATSANEASISSTDSKKVIIKPNVYSWRGNNVANMFEVALNYKDKYTSHMMKNTEWGAVAYLSLSNYGINNEINLNNNNGYLTGYSATSDTDQSTYAETCTPSWGTTMCSTDAAYTQPYNTSVGYKASTTGNISGIYDTSGGSHEYMAAYIEGYGVNSNDGIGSGFTQNPVTQYGSKYFDVYQNSTNTMYAYNNRILGDAIGEMGPFYMYVDGDNLNRVHNSWYSDLSCFISSTYPWLSRGGPFLDGLVASPLYFYHNVGVANGNISSRIVLAM